MSIHRIGLTLVEMYAIKHALQKQVAVKSKRLESIVDSDDWDEESITESNLLIKDIEHERALISRFETNILEYKACKNIK